MTMTMTRREMCLLLPAAMLPVAGAPLAEASEPDDSLPSASYAFEKLPVHNAPSVVQKRAIFKGILAPGDTIVTTATTTPPAGMSSLQPHNTLSPLCIH